MLLSKDLAVESTSSVSSPHGTTNNSPALMAPIAQKIPSLEPNSPPQMTDSLHETIQDIRRLRLRSPRRTVRFQDAVDPSSDMDGNDSSSIGSRRSLHSTCSSSSSHRSMGKLRFITLEDLDYSMTPAVPRSCVVGTPPPPSPVKSNTQKKTKIERLDAKRAKLRAKQERISHRPGQKPSRRSSNAALEEMLRGILLRKLSLFELSDRMHCSSRHKSPERLTSDKSTTPSSAQCKELSCDSDVRSQGGTAEDTCSSEHNPDQDEGDEPPSRCPHVPQASNTEPDEGNTEGKSASNNTLTENKGKPYDGISGEKESTEREDGSQRSPDEHADAETKPDQASRGENRLSAVWHRDPTADEVFHERIQDLESEKSQYKQEIEELKDQLVTRQAHYEERMIELQHELKLRHEQHIGITLEETAGLSLLLAEAQGRSDKLTRHLLQFYEYLVEN